MKINSIRRSISEQFIGRLNYLVVLQYTAVCVTLLICTIAARAQFNLTLPSMQSAQEIFPKAFSCYSHKKYDSAIIYLQRILAIKPPVSPLLRSFVKYHLAVNYCLNGKKEEALAALESAVGSGFAESEELEKNADLISLRNIPRFDRILDNARHNAAVLKRYDITRWENSGLGFALLHGFDAWSNEKFVKLREKYKLDTLRKPGFSELDEQISIMNWVHNRWKHNPLNIAPKFDVIDILDSVEQGVTYRCVEYAIVLSQTLQAMGYPARVIELHSKGVSYGVAKGHVAAEVWNNDLRKWIYLDAQTNAAWKYGNMFLNAAELRDMILDDRLDSVQMYVFPSSWLMREQVYPGEWIKYFYYLYYRLENHYAEDPESMTGLAPLCYLRPNQTPELLYQGLPRSLETTANFYKVYPVLNIVHADITQVSINSSEIDLKFEQAMPSFSRYAINSNGMESFQSDDEFKWHIQHGKNTITVRAVNQAGIMGPPMIIELNYDAL
ncbi:hypothetical protein MASR2M18_01600 [Ignavibacteria bacterium]|nr:transglutaminase domain-containing protein [Bacteroidota bacterium]MCZ2132769.1 transglutaminase-like domain-containing protein [Bacteroidota bacterium]